MTDEQTYSAQGHNAQGHMDFLILDVTRGFIKAVLDGVDEYKSRFGYEPKAILLREPFFDGVQEEFMAKFPKASKLVKIQGVRIEMLGRFAANDMEVV